jgi:gamma-glutamyltranspeptidase/glutathione hydrolase
VATAFPAASEAAMGMLRSGGNAVDAAVAAAWALSACEPSGSGLGGQTTMLIHLPVGRNVVLDGHSHGPSAAGRRTISRGEQRRGPRACTIPSTPATLGAASERFGRLPLQTVMAPAVSLAADGFGVTRLLRKHIQWCQAALTDSDLGRRRFLCDGRAPKVGAILRQPELAQTLERISASGIDDFYRGSIARSLVADMREQGGLITKEDLSGLDLPVAREALSIDHRGYRIVSAPPPGGGVQLLLGLRILAKLGLPEPCDLPLWYASIAQITRAVFREREQWPVRADGTPPSLLAWLVSEERAEEIAGGILAGAPHSDRPAAEGPGDTTHLCVADDSGMVVSLTQSVQSLFGSKVASPRLGFFYNNYLCTCPRYRHPSRLASGATPQSNVAPTMMLRRLPDGALAPVLAIGAAGSRRITSSILQVMANVMHRGMDLAEAMDAPRIHATTSGRVMLERRAATTEVLEALSGSFHPIQIKAARSYAMGGAQAIARDAGGWWTGSADPRREGTADAA